MTAPNDLAAWSARYSRMRAIAERIARLRVDRARRLAARAGVDPAIPFLHADNALAALAAGRPWPGVDYSLVRAVRRLDHDRWIGFEILDGWAARTTPSRRGDAR